MENRYFHLDGQCYKVSGEKAARWDDSPTSLIFDDGSPPSPPTLRDVRRLYLDQNGKRRVKVSKAVFEMGKLPYPELRNIKHQEEGKLVPSFYPMEPWTGTGLIARYFTPEELIQRKIINLDLSSTISTKFEVDYRAIEAIKSGRLPATDNSGIHPVFKFEPGRWKDTSDLMYEYLKPSLRIVSKFLDMEVVLDFLTALGKPWAAEEPTPLHETKSYQKPYSFRPKPLTSAEREVTAKELIHMQDFVEFGWHGEHPNAEGITYVKTVVYSFSPNLFEVKGMHPYAGSSSATVHLNAEWKKCLDLDNAPWNSFVPNTDSRSRLLRTQFNFALTILHELIHAWCINTRREPPGQTVEPYCNDDRIAEVGWALTNAVFGSVLTRIADNPSMYDAPFGLSTIRFPGRRHVTEKGFAVEPYKGTPAKWGMDVFTEYAIPMDFVAQFFTEEFWDTRVERFGPGMLLTPKPFGVREVLDWEAYDFDSPESPRVKRKVVDGVEVDDPEPRSPVNDTLHPGIRDGVLFQDKAFDRQGNELDLRSSKALKRRRIMTRAPELDVLSPIAEVRSQMSPEDIEMPDAPSFGRGHQGYGAPVSPAPSVGQGYHAPSSPAPSVGQIYGDRPQAHSDTLAPNLPNFHPPGSNKPLPPFPDFYPDTRPVIKRDLFKSDLEVAKKHFDKKADRKIAKVNAKTKDIGEKAKGLLSPIKLKGLFKPKEKGGYEEIEPYEWS